MCGTPTPTEATAQGGVRTRPSLQSVQAVMDTRRRLERALGSQFTVEDLVGRGGFAEVFSVRDQRLKRDLACKVLSPELVVNQAMLTRFRREAEAIAALRHPGIVPIYDIGEAGGIAYIVMPLIKGDTLRKRLEVEGRFSIAESRRILVCVCDALAVAHEAGLVHRDIKPENVMLEGPRNQVLVMDFGIAKAIDPEATGVTTSGLIVGTPHYMSPEQATGEPVDSRSDQYSLAVMGYRMVTGTHPFEAETTRALLYKQVFETAPTASERDPNVPGALSRALARGMSKDAKDRFATIEEFARALQSDEDGLEESAASARAGTRPATVESPGLRPTVTAAPAVPKAQRPGTRPRWALPALWSAGGVLLVGVVAVAALLSRSGTSSTASSTPVDSTVAAAALPVPDSVVAGEAAPAETVPTAERPPGRATAPRGPAASVPPRPSASRPASNAPSTCTEAVQASAWSAAATLCLADAEQGDVEAQLALAGMLERGQGVSENPAAAIEWYDRAAQAGSGEAAWRLGQMVEQGRGVSADLARAGQLYLQAARRNVVPAMRATAFAYETGVGLPKNERDMINWYRRAAAAGDPPAQVRLGTLYFEGRGVSRNEQEGARWFARAATAGDPAGQYAYGMAHLAGRGVEQSDSLGIVWLTRAAAKGHALAAEELARRQP